VDSDLATSWALIATSCLAYSLLLIPLRGFGFELESLGYGLTHAFGALPGLLALSSLFVASGLEHGTWRTRFHRAAWLIVGLTAALTLYAMLMSPRGGVGVWGHTGF
jgi:hypothetical protein